MSNWNWTPRAYRIRNAICGFIYFAMAALPITLFLWKATN
jgi:hypothetical protein